MSIYSDMRAAVRLGTLEALVQSGYPTTPVIFSHQNGSEPAESYVVIQIVSLNQIGHSQQDSFTDDGLVTKNIVYKSYYEGVIQFTFAGSQAPDIAHDFQNSVLGNVIIREAYQSNNLAPVRKSNLRRAPQKRDTTWVEFFNIDVTFSYAVLTEQTIDWVEHVTIDINDGDVVMTIPPLVP